MRTLLPLSLALFALSGCKGDTLSVDTLFDTSVLDTADPDTDSEFDTDTDGDSDTDSDTTLVETATSNGFAFCAGGARVDGGTMTATVCVGSSSAASGNVTSGTTVWQSGPIAILAP